MAESESQTLKQDLESLRNDFQSLAQDVRTISENQARAGASTARSKASEWTDEACQRSKEFGAEIEARPYTSVATAFGAGLLLGALFKRRGR